MIKKWWKICKLKFMNDYVMLKWWQYCYKKFAVDIVSGYINNDDTLLE